MFSDLFSSTANIKALDAVRNHQLMKNAYNSLNPNSSHDENVSRGATNSTQVGTKLMLALNAHLIHQYGHELFPDPEYFMTAPIIDFKGKIVEARSRRLAARIFFSESYSRENFNQHFNQLVTDIRLEMATELELLAKHNTRMFAYVPVTTSGVLIDPLTFEPIICLGTRYGLLA